MKGTRVYIPYGVLMCYLRLLTGATEWSTMTHNDPPSRGTHMRMKDCLILLAALGSLAPPVFALTADRILGFPGRPVLLLMLPALFLLLAVFVYSVVTKHGAWQLILWGAVGGFLGTVALDAVRLVGVKAGAFPMDLPRMFGLIASDLAPEFQTNTMAALIGFTADLPDEARRQVMGDRIDFLAGVDETSRRAFMGAMVKGLEGMPPEKRMLMMDTQTSLFGEIDSEAAQTVSATMSSVMGTGTPVSKFPSGIELYNRVPQTPMAEFRRAAEISYARTVEEAGTSDLRVSGLGYLWHFMIGGTFGIAYVLLFGRGRWLWALGWGTFVWGAMMVLMPVMMPMIDFPWWFPGVPFLAHLAMAVPIGWVALHLVKPEADAKSFVGLLRGDRQAAAMPS